MEWQVLVESAAKAGNLEQIPYAETFVKDDKVLTNLARLHRAGHVKHANRTGTAAY